MTQVDFQKLKLFFENELKITEQNIMEKSIQLSNFYSKTLQIYSKELRILKMKKVEMDKTFGELYHKYKFKYDFQLDTKAEVETYIKSDDIYYKLALEYAQQEVQVNFLEQTLGQINNMGYRIKNFIDLKKISQGMM